MDLARNSSQSAGIKPVQSQSSDILEKELKQLKSEIAQKNKQLSSLQAKLKNQPAGTGVGDPGVIKDLEVRNQRLSTAYNIALPQVGVFNKKYKVLQNEHAALTVRLRLRKKATVLNPGFL